MIESCASLVGTCSCRGMPRIMSDLAPEAEGGRAAIDCMGGDEPGSAAVTWKPRAPVSGELPHEAAWSAARVSVVAKTGAPRLDGLRQHRDDRVAEQRCFLDRKTHRRA